MVAVFNKDLLSWYLITLKLKETVDAGLQNTPTTPTPTPTTSRSISFPEFPLQQQQHRLLQKEEYHPADSLKITIEENVHTVEEGPKSPESEWVISIKDKLEQAKQDNDAGSWAKLSIYRVPLSLRRDDDKAYIPQIVSLGPYHHGKKRLRNMDRHKWRAVLQILKRTDQEIKMYIDAVRELEEKARACYEGTIAMNSNEFVEMMVLDSCFVLELFRGVAGGFQHLGYARNDPVFAMRGSMHSIQRDMIMIENQIPLFILDRLYGIQSDMPHEKGIVARLALRFFDPLMPTDEPLTKSDLTKLESSMGRSASFDPLADLAGLHCLDVFRYSQNGLNQ